MKLENYQIAAQVMLDAMCGMRVNDGFNAIAHAMAVAVAGHTAMKGGDIHDAEKMLDGLYKVSANLLPEIFGRVDFVPAPEDRH